MYQRLRDLREDRDLPQRALAELLQDRKSTRLNSSHMA